jgi:putative copper export protein
MIIEYLQPDADIWDGVTVILRAGYYAATLGAAGLALFGVAYGHRLDLAEERAWRRWTIAAVLLGLVLSLLALAVRMQVLTAGAGLLNYDVWFAMMRSRIGDAFYLRAFGLVLILAAVFPWRAGLAIGAIGAFLVVASYAAMGHSMLFRPRQELALLVVVHLLAVAFWIGSLPMLRVVTRRGDTNGVAALITSWSRAALVLVALTVASGAALILHLAPRVDLVTGSWWGWGLIAKLAIVALVMGFAAWHKLSLTPALAEGRVGAGARLSRSIGVEMIVVLLVFWAVAEMVSVHPIDIGHRITS